MNLDHPNVHKIYQTFRDDRKFYLVSEYINGQNLFQMVANNPKFNEHDAVKIISQVLKGAGYCHGQGLAHRDLRAENIIIERRKSGDMVKIINFGLSLNFNDPSSLRKDIVGQAHFMAPEIMKKKYDFKCDIWSIGVLLYTLLSGKPPFNGKNDEEILQNVLDRPLKFPGEIWRDRISKDAKELLKLMLEKDPAQRCNAAQALQQPWFLRRLRPVDLTNMRSATNQQMLENLRRFNATLKI